MTRQRQSFELGDYVDVATRITEFREKYPDGRLRPLDPSQPYRIERIGDDTFIVYVAAAYRSADDPLPGVGTAQEAYPGKTRYTQGSELQNAETSAWGRAIVAALAADTKRGIASADEVRNRQAERDTDWEDARPRPQPPSREQIVVRAREAIAAAPDKETLDKLELRLMQREHEGAITAEDAIELRRAWVARLDEIAPAGEAQAAQQVVDLPVTQKQHKRMHALWREVGLGGEEHRDARLTRTSLIVGRDIDSSAQLTAVEADSVIDTLDAEVKAAKEVGA